MQDTMLAIRWFRLAAAQGNAQAEFYMSMFLFKGEDLVQDKNEAYFRCLLSAASGYEDAQKYLGIIEKEINIFEREQLKSRAMEWIKEHNPTLPL